MGRYKGDYIRTVRIRRSISEKAKLRWKNPEYLRKMTKASTGRRWTPEMKLAVSVANKGKKHTQLHRKRISKALTGRKLSKQHI